MIEVDEAVNVRVGAGTFTKMLTVPTALWFVASVTVTWTVKVPAVE